MSPDNVSVSYKSRNETSKHLFDNLLGSEEFADVTLLCEDDHMIKAHKVVLCAFSPFFKNIMLNIPSPHPVIYITGISYKDLLSILQFIYKGETQIEDTDLNSFLDSGSKLKVLGIYPEPNFDQRKFQNFSQICPGVFTEDIAHNDADNHETSAEDISDMRNVQIKEEPADDVGNEVFLDCDKKDGMSLKEELIDELVEQSYNTQAEKIIDKVNIVTSAAKSRFQDSNTNVTRKKLLTCNHCQFKTVNFLLLKKHIHKIHLSSLVGQANIPCNYCNRNFSSLDNLNVHKTDVHNVVRA